MDEILCPGCGAVLGSAADGWETAQTQAQIENIENKEKKYSSKKRSSKKFTSHCRGENERNLECIIDFYVKF